MTFFSSAIAFCAIICSFVDKIGRKRLLKLSEKLKLTICNAEIDDLQSLSLVSFSLFF